MARPGITYARVAKVGTDLTEAGTSVTVDSVREALGGTGSKSTIAPLVKRWKTEHEARGGTLATGLPAHLLEVVSALNERILADADSKIVALTETHEQALQEINKQLSQADERAATVAKNRDALARQLAETRGCNETLARQNQELQLGNTKSAAEIAGLNDRLSDRIGEIKGLQDAQTKARQQFEHYQQSIAEQRAEERQQNAQQMARLEQELTASRKNLAAAQIQATQAETRLEDSTQAHLRQQAQMQDLQAAHQGLVAERPTLLHEISTLRTRNTVLEAQLEVATEARAVAQTELAVAKHALVDVSDRLKGLERYLVDADTENRRLLQENSLLQGRLEAHPSRSKG